MLSPELSAVSIWCESIHKFGSYRLKCDFAQMIHMIRILKWIILMMLHYRVKGNNLT